MWRGTCHLRPESSLLASDTTSSEYYHFLDFLFNHQLSLLELKRQLIVGLKQWQRQYTNPTAAETIGTRTLWGYLTRSYKFN